MTPSCPRTDAGRRARLAVLFSCVAVAALAGCGGGGSSSPPPVPGPPPAAAALTLSLTGGRTGGYDHVWVTVAAVALNGDATKPYDATDATWTTYTLATPVTLDLASSDSTSGALTDLLKNAAITPGSYAQLRLLVADPDADLVASAVAAGLHYNDQVDFTDTARHAHSVPLEFAGLGQGLALAVPITIANGGAAFIALEWDAASSLVRRASPDGIDRFVVRNVLRAYDRTRTGAVLGVIDGADFCTTTVSNACISDVTVSVEAVAPMGTTAVLARTAQVVTSGTSKGAFFLYPLPDVATVDVVVRGRHMDTIVVRDVYVQPEGVLVTVPTAVGSASAPLVPVRNAVERAPTLAAATSPPSTQAAFFQSAPAASGPVPLQVAEANTDPATGLWTAPLALPSGPLHVADYDKLHPDADLVFTTTSPVEGDGGFQVQLLGPSFSLPSALSMLAPASATWTPPVLDPVTGLVTGNLQVHVNANKDYDHAELLIANDSGVVAVRDVSALMGLFGGTTSFALPSGTNAADPLATLYTATLRAWKSSSMSGSLKHVAAPGVGDLRSGSTATLNVSAPP
jgi:hypothetical protein